MPALRKLWAGGPKQEGWQALLKDFFQSPLRKAEQIQTLCNSLSKSKAEILLSSKIQNKCFKKENTKEPNSKKKLKEKSDEFKNEIIICYNHVHSDFSNSGDNHKNVFFKRKARAINMLKRLTLFKVRRWLYSTDLLCLKNKNFMLKLSQKNPFKLSFLMFKKLAI